MKVSGVMTGKPFGFRSVDNTRPSFTQPFAGYTGNGVKIGIIDSGVNPAHPHVGGVAGGVRISSAEENTSLDYLDYLGHGTAVAGAIHEKAPLAQLFAVKVFDRSLTTNIEVIIKAVEWCAAQQIDIINLSLGTTNEDHREIIQQAIERAANIGTVLVAASEMSGERSFPGCLKSVIGVAVDWECSRDRYKANHCDGNPAFSTSPYPRDIPGVPREQNLKGASFAVANMTGFVARARECAPGADVERLKRLLLNHAAQ